jgi:hypothetical protein
MDAASSRWQIVLAEDNPADIGLVRLSLRDRLRPAPLISAAMQ